LTVRCLAALRGEKRSLPELRAVVVDGGSGDGSATILAQAVAQPDYRDWVSFLPLPLNGGFGWSNNQAMLTLARQSSPPEFIHLLNPDTEIIEGAVVSLVEHLRAHARCGAAGSQLLGRDGEPAASAFTFPSAGLDFVTSSQSEFLGRLVGVGPRTVNAEHSIEVDWVTGASVMFRSAALRETGLFDDGFFLYFEEVELMHRLRARGWTVRHVPASRVVHIEGASTGVGAAAAPGPLPAYWYRSRRRYFTLTGGASAALGANLAWLAGHAAGKVKAAFGRTPPGARVRDLMRFGFWPRPNDGGPSVPAWGDAPGKPPAWMAGP
jgi:N-acetylglucosaminyl-diphospho-decaprenol L-rhamnosyltransferase